MHNSGGWRREALCVMPGLDPGIHVFLSDASDKTWMAGTKPGHDGALGCRRAPWLFDN